MNQHVPSSPRTVGVVGAGRVGAVVAARLRAAGHHVVAASGRSAATRTRVETLLPGVPLTTAAQAADRSDLLVLAVPDDSLVGLVDELAADGHLRPGQVVLHTSGRHGLAALASAAAAGARPVAMHPAMTFTGTDVDLDRLSGCVFGLTVGDDDAALAESLVADLGGRPVRIPEDRRTAYHAALAHGSNHLVTLVAQSMDLLRATGADDPSALLRPLLQAALDNVLAYGSAALTGPVVRGDVDTVAAHLAALADAPASTHDAYVAMARATTDRAVTDGRLTPSRGSDVRRVLDEADWDTMADLAAGL
ncbi:Rossmann-like and DUF2520 domain-containing protein [Solicola sp. PLA-1-18]|uniref:Rossmann-like and DUF2520 domain-containing protein n=1 Tax=Solicola sp. PLA-1-18 TaxID=3380532 RepID=UPI003B76C487